METLGPRPILVSNGPTNGPIKDSWESSVEIRILVRNGPIKSS